MAEVIKEVTKELKIENDRKLGEILTMPTSEKKCKQERRCLPWMKKEKYEEKLRKKMQLDEDDDEDEASKKKGSIFEISTKIKGAKHGKSSVKKKYEIFQMLMDLDNRTNLGIGDASLESIYWLSLKWLMLWTTRPMNDSCVRIFIIIHLCISGKSHHLQEISSLPAVSLKLLPYMPRRTWNMQIYYRSARKG